MHRSTGIRLLAAIAALLLGVTLCGPAAAHLTPNSEIRLDFSPGSVAADIVVPQSEFGYATALPTDNSPASLAQAQRYLERNVAVIAPDGRHWALTIDKIEFAEIIGPPDLHATAHITPPPGATDRRFTFEWHALTREVPTHFALLVIGEDLAGHTTGGRELVGALTAARPLLSVDRGTPSSLRLLVNALRLGAQHIAGGHDHLLFLLALLLPAPLLAAGYAGPGRWSGRWGGPRPSRDTLRRLALIVTAFTCGHSLTLIAAALFSAHLPAPPVEAGIALSVLISAVHAGKPIFPGREPLVALLFGLVHGLAFATVISNFGLDASTRAIAILGFNLGIEAVQLLVVLCALPALLFAANSSHYTPVRVTLATLIGIAAAVWLVERVSGTTTPLSAAFEVAIPWCFAAVVAASALVLLRSAVLRLPARGLARPV
ncbi:HupE/UreJ family protein [Novosphingobium lentum]|uniref:HupE/UreJ family protein n=1 Tax=Novosphingobium lentum TaxID=145287 RepID=UPI00083503AD|nr:HupE/UreJ family protein [Novosphingobium lentum]